MEHKIIFKDLGLIRFQEAWDYQKNLFNQTLDLKIANLDLPVCEQTMNYNFLLFCEHPHVYTLGKSGSENNLLIDQAMLQNKGAEFYKIDRGGDITYHGPGQIVGYPIFDLEAMSIGLKEYIHKMEDVVIETLSHYHIQAGRLDASTGVWLDPGHEEKARKICAIGVKSSRFVTMHGFAFNINTNLDFYNYINPCGFVDKGVTSLQKELGQAVDMEEVKTHLLNAFKRIFNIDFDSEIKES